MARPEKPGLSYINVDIDIFDDPKLMFVYERFAEKGELITIKLLLFIYANGYYVEWSDEVAVLFANRKFKNVSSELVKDVVEELLKRKFLDEPMFKKFSILTSKGIQKRWLKVIKDSKRKGEISTKFDLLTELIPKTEEETPDETELTTPTAPFIPSFQEETTQSKEEEIIVNNSKVNESKEWNTFPTSESQISLTEKDIKSAIEQIKITTDVLINAEKVNGMVPVFINQKFTGERYYRTEREAINHFLNWIKGQKFLNNGNNTGSFKKGIATDSGTIKSESGFGSLRSHNPNR